ncbi:unnamed protein product [Symbiodinium sp. CCMP2592]|nr:unnamed protein product [Symbiodinium sp. CCMP2592]
MTIPVELSFVEIPVRKRRPLVKKINVWYPVIYPSAWAAFLLKEYSFLVLGGVDLQEMQQWQQLLSDFWSEHKLYDPGHDMHAPMGPPPTHTVPIYIHGDEGRGKYKLPIMVEGHTYCTRFLFTVLPAELYWGDSTLNKLNKAFAEDLMNLFTKGEWYNFAKDAPWRNEDEAETPFADDKSSPFWDVPGMSDPQRALVDPAHTWHIGWPGFKLIRSPYYLDSLFSQALLLDVYVQLRVGRDFVVSGLVLLCKLGLVRGRGLQSRLTTAYSHYAAWCHENKKSTNIRSFTLSAFKIAKMLAWIIRLELSQLTNLS